MTHDPNKPLNWYSFRVLDRRSSAVFYLRLQAVDAVDAKAFADQYLREYGRDQNGYLNAQIEAYGPAIVDKHKCYAPQQQVIRNMNCRIYEHCWKCMT